MIQRHPRRLASILTATGMVIAACGGQAAPTPSPTQSEQATAPTSSEPSPTQGSQTAAPIAAGTILFQRHDTATDRSGSFAIKPDGSGETRIGAADADVACSSFSSDGAIIGCTDWLANGGRPALAAADGSGLRVLDPNPGEQRSLQCDLFDTTRFVCGAYAGDGGPAISDHGLHAVSATDGSEIKQLSDTPDACNDVDVVPSSDRKSIVLSRICGPNDEEGTVYRVGVDGKGLLRLSPSALRVASVFGKPDAAWSPDGSLVAFGAYVPAANSTALFVVRADGTDVRRIVSPDVGAVTVAWSPDGNWIAFTSTYLAQPQVWLVHPDGTGLVKLTDGSDGSVSVGPVWSPDGTSLLFARARGVADGIVAGATSLWTMSADGTNQTQLIALPNPASTGGYAWGAAVGP